MLADSSVSGKRLKKTIDHVLRYWIPINKNTFKKIQNGLASGLYVNDSEQLLKDIRSDLSLYAWCLQQICRSLSDDEPLDRHFDPIRTLDKLSYQELKDLLAVSEEEISQHSLEQSSEDQVRILKEAMLSATAADVIAQSGKEDRAYGASVLRQLGLTLIAWNYSSIFDEVVAEVKKGKDLDTEVVARLGFSPVLLAMKVVQSWGVNEKKCHSLGLMIVDGEFKHMNPEIEKLEQDENYLREVCEVGEKLARANDNINYPVAKDDWEEIEQQFKKKVGDKAIAKIREKFEGNLENYSEVFPDILANSGIIFDERRYPKTQEASEIEKKNKYIATCSADTQLKLKNLYRSLQSKSEVNENHIRKLIFDIAPVASFTGCCIYTFDPARSILFPQLHSGDIELRKIRSYNYTMNTTTAGLIQSAYQSHEPLLEEGVSESGMRIGAIAGTFGKSRKIGVNYMEYKIERFADAKQLMSHFRAMTAALNDCLNLR